MSEHSERIDLEAPLSGDFQAVVRLIVGGIAERVDFAFEEIDDLQLAVERLLAEAGTDGSVKLVVRGRRERHPHAHRAAQRGQGRRGAAGRRRWCPGS